MIVISPAEFLSSSAQFQFLCLRVTVRHSRVWSKSQATVLMKQGHIRATPPATRRPAVPDVPARRRGIRRCRSLVGVSSDEGPRVTVGAPRVERGRPRFTQVDRYTPIAVERSGPAIRAALGAHAPARCAQFEVELRSALAQAAQNFDLSGPQAVLTHWHAVATMAANPLTDDERNQIERAKAGDVTGLTRRDRDEKGNWVRL